MARAARPSPAFTHRILRCAAVATPWDQRARLEQRRTQNIALRQTVLQQALAHVPFVRARLSALGLDARVFGGLDDLTKIPPSMRRDVIDPARNPDGPSAILLHGTAEGVKRFSDRSVLRRIAMARLLGGEDVEELAIESATRLIHTHLVDGPGGRLPVGYTRDDLDLLARAGARTAQVAGVDRSDRLLNLVAFAPSLNFWGIFYLAHGLGMQALHARGEGADIADGLRAFPDSRATVVAIPTDEVVRFPSMAADAGLDLSEIRTVLAVGRSLTEAERLEAAEGLANANAPDARVVAIYGPAEGRVLWAECPVPSGHDQTYGFHTYPDLDVVEIVSPETAERLPEETPGEIVITSVGFRGGGVPRWRTGDLALGGMTTKSCPNCARTVPRVGPSVLPNAWRHTVAQNGSSIEVDLRDAAAAAAERSSSWQVEIRGDDRGDAVFVYLAAGEDVGPALEVYRSLGRIGAPPAQIVLQSEPEIAARLDEAEGPWPRYVESTVAAAASGPEA